MTAVCDDGSREPRVHGFVVGVGQYLYLQNVCAGLVADLQCATDSAAAVVGWLRSPRTVLRHPLGSLELLGSPRRDGVGIASKANFRKAWEAWKPRCARNKENIAFFFFCGHGVRHGGSTTILLEDAGRIPKNLNAGGVDIETSLEGLLWTLDVGVQCSFVDACRVPLPNSRGWRRAQALEKPDGSLLTRDYAIVFSTEPTERAWAPSQVGQTYFTRALLRALRGSASVEAGRKWNVDIKVLGPALRFEMERASPKCNQQTPDPRGHGAGVIAELDTPPNVSLTLTFDPRESFSPATVTLTPGRIGGTAYRHTTKRGGSWTRRVRAGGYVGRASTNPPIKGLFPLEATPPSQVKTWSA